MQTAKPKLFSYTVRVDDGAAPNPFNGICTLAICKPRIRRVAEHGDWVAGTGSARAQSGDLRGRLVYAMRVDEVLSLAEYDKKCRTEWPHRIPDVSSPELSKRLGDCIYDYSSGKPAQRLGVHGPSNKTSDLSGRNVLISMHFYYFGGRALCLPSRLMEICHLTRGHRSNANEGIAEEFIAWIEGRGLEVGQLYGWPDHIINWKAAGRHDGCPPGYCNRG